MNLLYTVSKRKNSIVNLSFLLLFLMGTISLKAQLTQNFSSSTFPPTGWSLYNDPSYSPLLVKRLATVNGYGTTNGTGAVHVDFWNAPSGTRDSLSTPVINSTLAGDSLVFDHAHTVATGNAINDSMGIFVSSDGGTTWNRLIGLQGSQTNIGCATCLSTRAGGLLIDWLSPAGSDWMTKKYALPVGTNRVSFVFYSNYGENMFLDNVIVTRNNPMQYDSAAAIQVTDTVFQGMTNAAVLNAQVYATYTANPLAVTELHGSTSGSTSASDILKASLYYSGSNGAFNASTATLLATINNPSGKFSFTGFSQTLAGATSNFWIVYDISQFANVGSVVDATFDSIKVNGVMQTSAITDPAGNRYIQKFDKYNYCNFGVLNVGGYMIGPSNVQFGSINNTTGDFDKVTNYANQINTMVQGDSTEVYITVGPGNAEQVAIYVDWNNNGTFESPQEEVYYASQVAAAGTTGLPFPSASSPLARIKVPCSAAPGYHRMRVVSDWYAAPRVDPCSTKYYGEGEDYTIEVKAQAPPHAAVSAVDTFYTNGMMLYVNTSSGAFLTYEWDFTNDGTYDAITKNGNYQYATNGTYFCKLRVTSTGCTGIFRDSVIKKVVIITPPAATTANFISDKNVVSTTDIVNFFDLSTYGPGSWNWVISPTVVNGNTAFFYQNGTSSASQNPQVMFTEFGKYTVKLTAANVLGANTITKTFYINCVKSINMCNSGNVAVTNDDAGFLYDDGGKNGNYSSGHFASSLGSCTLLIKPACASTVSLKFKMFDMSIYQTPGGDFLKVYDGTSAAGTPLHTAIGWPAGIQNLINNVAWLPPTLVATSGAMFIEFWTDGAFQAKGFAAEWSSTPVTGSTPPSAVFNVPDTIYTGISNTYIASASGTGNNYDWDFNNDGIFDASGANATYTYATPTSTIVKCVVSSCSGTTTLTKNVIVLNPTVPPIAAFIAAPASGTPLDVFKLMDASKNGASSWQWTITPATYSIISGSLNTQNLELKFNAIGTYTVKLSVTNAYGADSLTKNNYLKVFYYCIPNVNITDPDIGISNVTFGNINNTTSQGITGYTDYTSLGTTNMELGSLYPITIKRNTNANAINRKVWVDLNGNGTFTDAGELLFEDSNSTTLSVTTNIKIPPGAQLGSSRLRVGVNVASSPNLGCGANYFGEFEDYRINIISDVTKPVITLNGADTLYVEAGYVFNDPGATATDNVNNPQNYTATYIGFTNGTAITAFGTYTINYNAIDSAGNQAITKVRKVIVTPDVTKPVITLNGADTIYLASGSVFNDPGATAFDFFYGPVTPVTVFGTVNTNVVGVYTLSYAATDLHGNAAISKVRKVFVIDTIAPVITVNGANPFYWNVHAKPFVDPGVTASDNYCTSGLNIIASTINLDSLGTYTITYSLKDCNGNVAISKNRTVIVQDTVPPVLTFTANTDTFLIDVLTLTLVPEPGYTLSDNYYPNSQLTVAKSGSVNLNVLGNYPVTYTVKDPSQNVSRVYTRVFKIVDRVKPVITLKGSSVANVYRWQVYNDSGATVTDNYYTSLIPNVSGLVDVNLPGIYYLSFNVTDPSGNIADVKQRIVNVKESFGGINDPSKADGINIYPNPNDGKFTLEIATENIEGLTIAIFDLTGNKIKDLNKDKVSKGIYQFDLTTLAAGNYLIQCHGENINLTKKLTIIKK